MTIIDKVTLNRKIKPSLLNFDNLIYKEREEMTDFEGKKYFEYEGYLGYLGNGVNQIKVWYSIRKSSLRLEGRFVNTKDLHNRVYNYDDYIIKRKEVQGTEVVCSNGIDNIIHNTNRELNELLGTKHLDIRFFTVSSIEICFNVWLKDNLVKEYIKIFTNIWKRKDYKGYSLFPEDEDEKTKKEYEEGTSFHVKTKGDKNKRKRTNRIINFYDKENQLYKAQENKKMKLTEREKELSKNLLRLEVQLYYQYLLRKTGKSKTRYFIKFLDLPFTYKILVEEYKFFIGNPDLDFYSYRKAKEIAERTDQLSERERRNLINDMVLRYRNKNWRSSQTQRKYNKVWERLGIHPIFIPRKIVEENDIDYLPSPIKLLDEKLDRYLANAIDSKLFKLKNQTL